MVNSMCGVNLGDWIFVFVGIGTRLFSTRTCTIPHHLLDQIKNFLIVVLFIFTIYNIFIITFFNSIVIVMVEVSSSITKVQYRNIIPGRDALLGVENHHTKFYIFDKRISCFSQILYFHRPSASPSMVSAHGIYNFDKIVLIMFLLAEIITKKTKNIH